MTNKWSWKNIFELLRSKYHVGISKKSSLTSANWAESWRIELLFEHIPRFSKSIAWVSFLYNHSQVQITSSSTWIRISYATSPKLSILSHASLSTSKSSDRYILRLENRTSKKEHTDTSPCGSTWQRMRRRTPKKNIIRSVC